MAEWHEAFWHLLDGPIRANRFADSRGSPDSRESFRVSEPLFWESRFGRLNIAKRRFEAIRANRSHIMQIGGFHRIDSRESIRANRPDSPCESPGQLSSGNRKELGNNLRATAKEQNRFRNSQTFQELLRHSFQGTPLANRVLH